MEYRAVGSRCVVDFGALNLPIPQSEALAILEQKGFSQVSVDLTTLARGLVGQSTYRRGSRLSAAPTIVDCSSLMKWLYGQRGIWLPRRSIQQRELGEPISQDALAVHDLIFTSGYRSYFHADPEDGVGHVGIVTTEKTVIHAANSKVGVVEVSLSSFLARSAFRGARRYIPLNCEVLTFETPLNREVEIMDDVRWIILQTLPPPTTK